jgi:hypothetical protein
LKVASPASGVQTVTHPNGAVTYHADLAAQLAAAREEIDEMCRVLSPRWETSGAFRPSPKVMAEGVVNSLREAEEERDAALAARDEMEACWKRCAAWLDEANEACDEWRETSEETLAEIVRSMDHNYEAVRAERDAARADVESMKKDWWRKTDYEQMVLGLAKTFEKHGFEDCGDVSLKLSKLFEERDQIRAELARVAKELKDSEYNRDFFFHAYHKAIGSEQLGPLTYREVFPKKQPQPKESAMRRLAKATWRWVLVPAMVVGSLAHFVPVESMLDAARFESSGPFTEFQVCAKCQTSREAGAVCPTCGSRESTTLVGKEVTRAFLGVWPRDTRWSAEGAVATKEAK